MTPSLPTAGSVEPDGIPDPLPGSIVRPRAHVLAVRAQSLLEAGTNGRTALAWEWVLTGARPSPVSLTLAPGRPPSRTQILAEATAPPDGTAAPPGVQADYCDQLAETRRVLTWLAGASDEIPADCENRGHLIGARDDYARTDNDIRHVRDQAAHSVQSMAAQRTEDLAGREDRRPRSASQMEGTWQLGVRDLLDWVLGNRPDAPLSHRAVGLPAVYDLTYEEGTAEDLAARGRLAGPPADPAVWSHPQYGEAIAATIRWLRGETMTPPVDQEVRKM